MLLLVLESEFTSYFLERSIDFLGFQTARSVLFGYSLLSNSLEKADQSLYATNQQSLPSRVVMGDQSRQNWRWGPYNRAIHRWGLVPHAGTAEAPWFSAVGSR